MYRFQISFLSVFFGAFFLAVMIAEEIEGKTKSDPQKNDGSIGFEEIPEGYFKDMVKIPGGVFTRGTVSKEAQKICLKNNDHCKEKWFEDEEPLHSIQLDSFYLDKYEVTQKDYQRVMSRNPSEFKDLNLPVDSVTWYEAKEYCQKKGKRLPTEAEWEWAARGRKQSTFSWGNEAESHRANFCDRSCDKRWKEKQFVDGFSHTAPVGSFPANGYGLYDMAGNVYEWVLDWYDDEYYAHSPTENPKGPEKGSRKVMRGGSWINYSVGVRPSDRTEAKPSKRINFVGFRCAF